MFQQMRDAAQSPFSRREFLCRCGMGMGTLGLANLFGTLGLTAPSALADGAALSLAPRAPHFAPKAKRVIHFFLNGGPSHVDTFDPKPMLLKHAGKALAQTPLTERKTGASFPSPFEFQQYGKSGIEVSELFAKTAQHID